MRSCADPIPMPTLRSAAAAPICAAISSGRMARRFGGTPSAIPMPISRRCASTARPIRLNVAKPAADDDEHREQAIQALVVAGIPRQDAVRVLGGAARDRRAGERPVHGALRGSDVRARAQPQRDLVDLAGMAGGAARLGERHEDVAEARLGARHALVDDEVCLRVHGEADVRHRGAAPERHPPGRRKAVLGRERRFEDGDSPSGVGGRERAARGGDQPVDGLRAQSTPTTRPRTSAARPPPDASTCASATSRS